MKHSRFKTRILALVVILGVTAGVAHGTYHSDIDPKLTLTQVSESARQNNKYVLIIFGSDWCPDCRSLQQKMQTSPLLETISASFDVMYVDIGNWDRNMDFTRRFGNPVRKGIPSIAILGNEGSLRYVSDAGELASARSSKTEKLNRWFQEKLAEIAKN